MKAVELRSITKRFGKTVANENINFDLNEGEIHAVLGENGAGKTTLMNILSGLHQPDSGKIIIRGKEVHFRSPRDAIDAGIGMIHQHFMLIQSHTVLDNIILGTKLPIIINKKKLADRVSELCRHLNFHLNPYDYIRQLSAGEQQQVEIVKALYRGTQILILDEPTSILTPQESEALFEILKSMKDEGYSIIFVSHKFKEVLSISDRITILRKGGLVDTIPNQDLKREDLVELMVGKDFANDVKSGQSVTGEIVLKIENVVARNDRNIIALDNLSLTLKTVEILGISGVAGNGQLELAEVITGLRKVESGSINILGHDITGESVKEIVQLGVAYIPEDRVNTGSISTLGICDNILLKCYDLFSFFNTDEIESYSEELINRYNVTYSDFSTPVRHLSGGNLQKLIIARELREVPKLLVAVYPSRGLDIGASQYVREVLLNCRDKGTAVLLISEDLDELLEISDRIAAIYEGKLIFIPDKDIQKIGLAMAGS